MNVNYEINGIIKYNYQKNKYLDLYSDINKTIDSELSNIMNSNDYILYDLKVYLKKKNQIINDINLIDLKIINSFNKIKEYLNINKFEEILSNNYNYNDYLVELKKISKIVIEKMYENKMSDRKIINKIEELFNKKLKEKSNLKAIEKEIDNILKELKYLE